MCSLALDIAYARVVGLAHAFQLNVIKFRPPLSGRSRQVRQARRALLEADKTDIAYATQPHNLPYTGPCSDPFTADEMLRDPSRRRTHVPIAFFG